MSQLTQILLLPFLACIVMGTMLGYLGIHVLKREIIFIDIALAQVAAVGAIAAHFIFSAQPHSAMSFGCSMAVVVLAAAFYTAARHKIVQICIEAVIGISYAIAAAAALLLVGIIPGGHIHTQQILSGSLLWASRRDVVLSTVVFSAVGVCFYLFRKPLMRLSKNYRQGLAEGPGPALWDFVFYILLGVVITTAVRIAGIVVVFACLIIPATISVLFSRRLCVRMAIIFTAIAAGSIAGLLFAYYLDFSVGPAIAFSLGAELILAGAVGKLAAG